MAALTACGGGNEVAGTTANDPPEQPVSVVAAEDAGPDRAATQKQAAAIFGVLPDNADRESNPYSQVKADLGRMLYYDTRLSKNHDVSCNSCHLLDQFGQDGQATSPGHRGQRGDRSSPSVYNAAFHVAQFWDGRAADVEPQARVRS